MWTKANLERYSTDMRQFIEARESTLPNGLRQIEVQNSSGFNFTLLPDRGMDIWSASYLGKSLTWISHGSPYFPDFGSPWLRQFNGGLLATCGLLHAGQPENDSQTGEFRDLHGNFSRLRAHAVSIQSGWGEDERYHLEIRATLTESKMFGEQLQLERVYRVTLGEPSFELSDTVTNLSDVPSPLMILYHVNVGYPLVNASTRLHTPWKQINPRNETAAQGLDTWHVYTEPIAGLEEKVFFHHLCADEEGWTQIALVNDELGLELAWQSEHAPYFTQWKNVREGMYVSGIEPGNCIPEGQNSARESGRLVMLQPRESQSFTLRLSLTDDRESLIQKIQNLRETGQAIENCHLD